jgi:Tfp pilus assembly pilus retraction ATPase PilT
LKSLTKLIKSSKKTTKIENPQTNNTEYNVFINIGSSLDIPELSSITLNTYNQENKKDIFLKYNKFHKKFMASYCSFLKYYNTIEELEKDGYDINSHLMQVEKIKSKLEEKNQILINHKEGKRVLGVFLPDISVDIEFDEMIVIGNSIYNYFYGKGKDLNLFSNNHHLTLNDILQMMETNTINDVGIDPINDSQFLITAEVAKQNILLTKRPVVKDVILDIYNESMIEMGKDHTTEVPTMTGLLKKDLIDKKGNHVLRTFRFNFIKIKNGLTLSIRRFMNYDEIDKLGLDGLGYISQAQDIINRAIKEKRGINLIIGETNSGKSTLLSAILNKIYKSKMKIISIENPIEILMPYLQIDLTDTETADKQFKMTKEIAQKAILRHNPNVVLMNEIRTKDEIDFYAGLGLRGHMSFATLHAGSIENAIEILLKIVDESELRNILNLIMFQELIASKCKVCDGTGHIKDKPCKNCDGVGSDTVVPVYEIAKFNHLDINDNLRDIDTLIKQKKIVYLSKHHAIEELNSKNVVHNEDYARIMASKKLGA